MNKHIANFQGLTFKRSSQNRVYAFAIVCGESIEARQARIDKGEKWLEGSIEDAREDGRIIDGIIYCSDASWSRDRALAEKAAAQHRGRFGWPVVEIVPAVLLP